MVAMLMLARGYYELKTLATDAATASLRTALAAADETHDHPILAAVTVGLGTLCVARGELRLAARALELADVIRGTGDERDPFVIAVRAALRRAGIESSGFEIPERPIPALHELLRD